MCSIIRYQKIYFSRRRFPTAIKEIDMEEKKIIKLPESELEIMQGIWVLNEEGEKFVSASLVMKRFPALQRLKLTTVLTLITRLQTKGFIKTEKIGRSNCYTPLIPSDEYRRFATGDYVKKVYLGDKMDLISTLVSDETLTAEELAEIKAVIAKNEENK